MKTEIEHLPAFPEALGLRDAAQRLGTTYRTLKKAIDAGELRASQVAERGGWVVQRADLIAFLDAKATRAQGRPLQPSVPVARRRKTAPGKLSVRDGMGR